MGFIGAARSQRGLTLIELIIAIAVAAIMLQSALGSFQHSLDSARSEAALRGIVTLFSVSRNQALLTRRPVTVCALDESRACDRDWTASHRITAFEDGNRNRSHDPGEIILREIRWPMNRGWLSWRASLARRYIVFEETGATWQNGTLYYCPASGDARHARALVLSHSGRAYLTVDSNGDGLREDRQGKNLSC